MKKDLLERVDKCSEEERRESGVDSWKIVWVRRRETR